MPDFILYGCDTETTNLSPIDGEPIEISLFRLPTEEYRTWCLQPITLDKIQPEALRINGHKLEDILGRTKLGQERYRKPEEALIDIENWVAEDGMPASNRILLGHNVHFDREMLSFLWKKCNTYDTFPFNDKYALDTMQIEFFFNYINGSFMEGYSLRNLAKKYNIKQERAHSAEDDTKVMIEIFKNQTKIKNENSLCS